MCLVGKASSILSLVLVYQQLICVMPRDLQETQYVGLQEVMHGADRWSVAPAARRNDYWEMEIWKGNKCGAEWN